MTALPRWKNRPPGSTWGDFGADDQLGRLNLLTPEKVLQGIAEVKQGLSFCLSLPLDYPGGNKLNPRRYAPELRPTMRGDLPMINYPVAQNDPRFTDVVSDDAVLLYLQYSTQWDSFAHVGQMFDADGDGTPEMVYYNGYRAGEDVVGPLDHLTGKKVDAPIGAHRLGIENMAAKAVQGRGVMIDIEAHFGREHKVVGFPELMQVLEKDKVEIETGDMVCLRTGFAQLVLDMKKKPDEKVLHHSCAVLDGRDDKLLDWITRSGLSVLIADNYAVEALPSRPCTGDHCAALPLHEHCLFKLGVHLGELWHLSELADWLRARGRSRFLLTAPPLRLPGAVGSPTTPVATV
jgi:kynurenine formamidase